MRQIEIDLAVHKRIEDARLAFHETDNAILHRLLGINTEAVVSSEAKRSWSSKGVTLPHGTELLGCYSGQRVNGRVDDGRWIVNGRTYDAPSPAIQENVVTKSGKRTNLDGWRYWQAKQPGESSFTPLQLLKPRLDGDALLKELGL